MIIGDRVFHGHKTQSRSMCLMTESGERLYGINFSYLKNLPPSAKILDYGCGQGELTIFFLQQGYRVCAADVDDSFGINIRKRITIEQNRNFIFVTIRNNNNILQDKVGYFDLIIIREVLEHIQNPEYILNFLNKLLTPQGMLVLSVPTAFSEKYFSWWDRDWLTKSQHVNVFNKATILDLLQKTSFEPIGVEGKSFQWSLFWFLLAPFHIKHEMGNPKSHPGIVKIVTRVMDVLCSIPYMVEIGNKLFPKSYFFYAKKHKPRILIVYDYPYWILGKWASNIKDIFSNDYNIISMSMFHAYQDREYVKQVLDKVDILHILLPHCFPYFRELAPSIPIISTIHHWVEWGKIYSESAFLSQMIITGAGEWKDKLIEKGIAAEKIVVVHSGIEERYFAEGEGLLQKSEKITIGFFAKYDSNEFDRKGTRHFIKLLDYIVEIKTQNLFRVVLAGPGWDSYVDEIREHDIEVIYLNYVTDNNMPALYRSLDVYLMLSDIEGGPVTIVEAMASKCLVFSSNIGVAKDILIDKFNGILIQNLDYEDIYNKLIYYNKNVDERENICINAYNYAINNMLFKDTLRFIGDAYRKTLISVTKYNTKDLDVEEINEINQRFAEKLKIQ
jgi:glycosyltransferase involved in cell wall biosynthesis